MKFSYVLVGAAAAIASASPIVKRGPSDGDILNYALTLEHLEAAFYAQGVQNYTQQQFVDAGFTDPFYDNVLVVANDEKTHVQFLTSALQAAGVKPVDACTYAFPAIDVKSFVTLANVLEGVGVSAYLGAASSIMNKTYLTAAGSILTVEARHSAYLRSALGEQPSPQAFDDPLDFNEVYTVASPFIASCPESNPALPVKAFPSLTVTSTDSAMTGSSVTLTPGANFQANGTIYAAFITVTGPVWADVKPGGNGAYTVTIPQGVMGQSYVVLTSSKTSVSDDNILAGPAIVEIGSKMAMASGGGSGKSSTPSSTSMPSGSSSATSTSLPLFTGAANRVLVEIGGIFGAAAIAAMALL